MKVFCAFSIDSKARNVVSRPVATLIPTKMGGSTERRLRQIIPKSRLHPTGPLTFDLAWTIDVWGERRRRRCGKEERKTKTRTYNDF